MTTVFLIRHGESQLNVGKPTALHEGAKLTVRGVEQAKQVAAYLKSHTSLDLIIASRYQRAKETATFTRSLFPHVPSTEWQVQEFTYLASLHHETLSLEERRPLVQAYWEQAQPLFADGPGSESFEAFMKRGYAFIEQVKSMKNETIAIFSHEQFITMVLWLVERNPSKLDAQTMRDFKNHLAQHPIANGVIIRTQFRYKQFHQHYKKINEHLEQPVDIQREWSWAQEQKVILPVGS